MDEVGWGIGLEGTHSLQTLWVSLREGSSFQKGAMLPFFKEVLNRSLVLCPSSHIFQNRACRSYRSFRKARKRMIKNKLPVQGRPIQNCHL